MNAALLARPALRSIRCCAKLKRGPGTGTGRIGVMTSPLGTSWAGHRALSGSGAAWARSSQRAHEAQPLRWLEAGVVEEAQQRQVGGRHDRLDAIDLQRPEVGEQLRHHGMADAA